MKQIVSSTIAEPKILLCQNVRLNVEETDKHAVTKDGRPIHLTPKEFDLLLLMMKNVDRVLTHKQILNVVWGPAHTHDVQYLRVMIGQIRQKIENDLSDPEILLTEAGVGYR